MIDLVIIVLIAGAILRGFQLGLIRQLIHFLGFFIALFIAYQFSGMVTPYLQNYIPIPSFSQSTVYRFSETFQLPTLFYNAISFVLVFLGTKLLLNVGGAILHQIASLPGLAIVNRFSGAIVGFIQSILILIIVLNVVTVMPNTAINEFIHGSALSGYFLDLTPFLTEKLYHLWHEAPTFSQPTTFL